MPTPELDSGRRKIGSLEPWWSRKEFRKLFDDLDKDPQDILEMFERMFKSFEGLPGESEFEGSYFYGFSITQGPQGKPVIREFGNVRPSGKSVLRSDVREPLVDTVYDDRHDKVRVILDLPGVNPEGIDVKLNRRSVRIRASNGGRRYDTIVPLKVPIEGKVLKRTFNNGVLELQLRSKAPSPSTRHASNIRPRR